MCKTICNCVAFLFTLFYGASLTHKTVQFETKICPDPHTGIHTKTWMVVGTYKILHSDEHKHKLLAHTHTHTNTNTAQT